MHQIKKLVLSLH